MLLQNHDNNNFNRVKCYIVTPLTCLLNNLTLQRISDAGASPRVKFYSPPPHLNTRLLQHRCYPPSLLDICPRFTKYISNQFLFILQPSQLPFFFKKKKCILLYSHGDSGNTSFNTHFKGSKGDIKECI